MVNFWQKQFKNHSETNLKNTERVAMAIKGVYLLKKVPTPAVLVETGFLSNNEERALLIDPAYQGRWLMRLWKESLNFILQKKSESLNGICR